MNLVLYQGLRKSATFSLDCSILPWIRILYYRVLSNDVSSTIFESFFLLRCGIELRSPGPLVNNRPTTSMGVLYEYHWDDW